MDPPYNASRPLTATHQPWNILNFYATPAKNDPWVPRGVIQTSHRPVDARPRLGRVPPPALFLDLGSTASPSDCATLPGDSGYGGSRQTYSTASASVGGDDLTLDPEPLPVEATTRLATSGKYHCDECNASVRSQGELK